MAGLAGWSARCSGCDRVPRFVAPVLLLMLLAACSPAGVLNALAPRAGVIAHRDIAYAPGPRRALDVYAPAAAGPDAPVVVFFYGGGWEDGNRAMYRFVGAALAARGVVTVVPDYRLYPEIRFPAFMHDAAAAVAWTEANAGAYGGDPGRIFLMGHSAGGQIATLLALDDRYLCEAGVDPGAIAGVIGLAGPYDFLPLRGATLRAIFGPEAQWPRSQPIDFVSPAAPPMLLAAGSADKTVDPANATRLAARLTQDGTTVRLRLYRGIGHRMVIGGFASLLAPLVPVRRDTLAFIATHPARGPEPASCAAATPMIGAS